jgi:UDP-N-acetylglucosamine:LPS N-acetylglucosamine transferase
MVDGCFFFAGGGTGGHIYPAIAVVQQIIIIEPSAKIHFFCSRRSIDQHILEQAGLEFTVLPAVGFSARPGKFIDFCKLLMVPEVLFRRRFAWLRISVKFQSLF